MASVPRSTSDVEPVESQGIEVTEEEGRRIFDEAAREWLSISGEEFLRRYDAGEYANLVESEDNRRVVDLALLIPFARQQRAGGD